MPRTSLIRRVRAFAKPDAPAPAPAAAPAGGGATAKPKAGLASTSTPGSRVAAKFFEDYPRFFETSATSANSWRLNLRREAIFGENADIFAGKTVLDIASHDGRWSFAALAAGAKSVVGIEPRPELVKGAEENFAHYGIAPERYRFIVGDVYDVLAKEKVDVDVVMCLGFLYHTLRYNELMARIRECDPGYLIIDTEVAEGRKEPWIKIRAEDASREWNAVTDDFSYGDVVMSGAPNVKALHLMVEAYGFTLERMSDWGGLIRDNPEARVGDYRNGRRVTARCRSVAAG